MADDEAVVLACKTLVFCALCVHMKKKDNTMWVKEYMRKRETFGCYNYLLMSD